ncbi:MAG TPA: TetR/AcrR family transcriptional regulator [Ktedonobacteraceae bacterium]|nr:TetR/AcrR family transcriptional regulator [Ktedonobacteraceae bacterium]
MQTDVRSVRERILAAAVQLFAQYGYHAATMRDIARISGIQAASIYYHYASKQALLVEIMDTHMRDLNANLQRILQEQTPIQQRLHAAIANHIRLHTTFKAEFFIIDTEIRALEEAHRNAILSLRDQYETMLQSLLSEGMKQGIFRLVDIKVASYALIAMCTEVATWFRPGGRLSVQQVIDLYTQMISEGLLLAKVPAGMPGE